MLDINSLPAMGYVPTEKVRATFVFVPAQTHSHQGSRVGAPWGECTKRVSPRKGNSPGTVPGEIRNEDNDSPRRRKGIPGEEGIPG